MTAVSGGAYTLSNQTLTIDGNVSGNIVAADNSIVQINSTNSLSGNLTVQSGSQVAGAGRITGNLTADSTSVIRVGAAGLSFRLSQFVIDDFESYNMGDVRDVASPPWTAHSNTAFADIETAGSGNKALSLGRNGFIGVSRDMPPGGQIGNFHTATFFFRFNSRTDDPDHNFGLADQASTSTITFNDFEAQVRVTDDPNAAGTFQLDARNGGSFTASPLATGLMTDTWYNVWMVVNQATDTYDVYMNTGTADAVPGNKLNATPLSFRNGTNEILSKILGYANTAPINNGVMYDVLTYLDGVDLTNPLGGLDPVLFGNGKTLTVNGNFTMDAGATLELDIVSPSILDRLEVGGVFHAGGTLSVNVAPGAPAPQAGDLFDILDFGSANGTFAALTLPGLSAGLHWNTANVLTSGVLEVVAGLPGDFNQDGTVDASDYIVLRKNSGTEHDFNTWRTYFGVSSAAGGSASGNATVPEPPFLALAPLSLLINSRRRALISRDGSRESGSR